MRITKIEIHRLALPMVRSFKTGFGTIDKKQTVIVKLYTSDGLVGYGESASTSDPVYNHETVGSCFYVQENYIAPAILGKSFETIEEFVNAYSHIVGHPIARTGIECAFWHLLSQRDNKSLKQLFGGVQDSIFVGEGVGIEDDPSRAVAAAGKIVEQGYKRVKLKIEPSHDLRTIEAVRAAFPDVDLTVDANAAYRSDRDHHDLAALDRYNLSMIEQPFKADDLCGHAELQAAIKTPICLDESITSLGTAKTAIGINACQIINIKPGRVGGIVESIAIHDFAASHNVGVWCGGMGETGIGRAFNLAFASKEHCRYPADMSPYYFFYKEDLVADSYTVDDSGRITVPDVPGLGFQIRDNAIERYSIEKVVSRTTL